MIRTGRLFRVWKSGLVILRSSYKCDVSISQSSKGSLKYFVKHVKYCLCVYCRLYSVNIVWGTKKKGRMTSNCHKDTDWRNLVWWTNLSYNLKDVVVVVSTSSSRNVARVDVIVYVAVCLCELGFFHKWILRPGLASWLTARQRKYSEDIALLVVHFAAVFFHVA